MISYEDYSLIVPLVSNGVFSLAEVAHSIHWAERVELQIVIIGDLKLTERSSYTATLTSRQ